MKRIPLVDLKAQYRPLAKEVISSFRDIFRGMHLIDGPNIRKFEEAFGAFCGVPYAVSVGSGTEALHLALRGLGIKEGDEVITVPFTFIGTVEAILQTGATPVFVDIDPATYTMDISQVKRKTNRRTRAFLPVHLYGQPCDMTPLLRVSRATGIPVVEDAAQAHGALYRGRRIGSLGKVGCFSFYPSKNLGGYGEGGMVVTRDRRLAEKVRLLRDHGALTKYQHVFPGWNGRMDELQAAVLRIKLKHLRRWNLLRRRHAAFYRKGLRGLPLRLPEELPARHHVYHLFVIRTRERGRLRQFLLKQGIETGLHYPVPLHLQKALSSLGYRRGDFPESERASREVLSLPMYPELTRTDRERVIRTLRRFWEVI